MFGDLWCYYCEKITTQPAEGLGDGKHVFSNKVIFNLGMYIAFFGHNPVAYFDYSIV